MDKISKYIIDLLKDYREIRAHFPYFSEDSIGNKTFSSPDYYQQNGHNLKFEFDKVLTKSDIERLNRIGNWINQSALIRLAAILDQEDIIKKSSDVDKNIEGHREMEILFKLRNKFAHSRGVYNPQKNEQLMSEIIECFSLEKKVYDKYPIPIDEVIDKIFEKSLIYAKSKLKQQSDDGSL